MKRWIGCSVVTLSVAAGAVVVGAWSLVSYHVLIRERIEVEAKWSRIENVYHRRWSLANRLADEARGEARDPAPVESLSESCDHAARIILSPEILYDPERLEELRQLELAQRAAIAETLEAVRSADDGSIRALDADLRGMDESLAAACGRFNDSVIDYNRLIDRFPMSLFARLYGFRAMPSIEPTPVAGPGGPVPGED
jgi:LemA protein